MSDEYFTHFKKGKCPEEKCKQVKSIITVDFVIIPQQR